MRSARPDVQAYLEMVAANPGPSLVELDPAIARRMARESGAAVERAPRDMRRQDVTIPGRGGHPIPARLYHPVEGAAQAPLLLFYHGGGWVLGDVAGYDPLCSEIAFQLGMTVLSVDYRLGPEHLFPAAVEDTLDACRWAAAGPAELGHPVAGLVLAGDSAGGALAAVAASELLEDSPTPLLAQWLIYPVADLSKNYPSDVELSPLFGLTDEARERFYQHYFGVEGIAQGKLHPHASPLLGKRWQGLPPAVVMTCSLDPLRDQGRALAAKLVDSGIETIFYEAVGQVHGSFTMRKMLPSAQDDLLKGIASLRLLLAGSVAAATRGVSSDRAK